MRLGSARRFTAAGLGLEIVLTGSAMRETALGVGVAGGAWLRSGLGAARGRRGVDGVVSCSLSSSSTAFLLRNLVGAGAGAGWVILADSKMAPRRADLLVSMLLTEAVLTVVVDKKGGINDVG